MNIKNSISMYIIFLLPLLLNIGCTNSNNPIEAKNTSYMDTIQRPANISKQATLINFGSEDEPILAWAEYIGSLSYVGKIYSHIQGIKYYYVKSEQTDTVYYENLELRKGSKKFHFKNYKILNYPGEANVQISNGEDSLVFFHVLESDEFKRVHKGIQYKRIPAIYVDTINDNGFMSDEEVEVNIRKENNGMYIVTLTGNGIFEVPFKLCSTCKEEVGVISFLNKETGHIYFINQDCYLEPINKEDIKKLQALH